MSENNQSVEVENEHHTIEDVVVASHRSHLLTRTLLFDTAGTYFGSA